MNKNRKRTVRRARTRARLRAQANAPLLAAAPRRIGPDDAAEFAERQQLVGDQVWADPEEQRAYDVIVSDVQDDLIDAATHEPTRQGEALLGMIEQSGMAPFEVMGMAAAVYIQKAREQAKAPADFDEGAAEIEEYSAQMEPGDLPPDVLHNAGLGVLEVLIDFAKKEGVLSFPDEGEEHKFQTQAIEHGQAMFLDQARRRGELDVDDAKGEMAMLEDMLGEAAPGAGNAPPRQTQVALGVLEGLPGGAQA